MALHGERRNLSWLVWERRKVVRTIGNIGNVGCLFLVPDERLGYR